eukprot:jgi/Tetstr1/446454/TSEL_033995.t1
MKTAAAAAGASVAIAVGAMGASRLYAAVANNPSRKLHLLVFADGGAEPGASLGLRQVAVRISDPGNNVKELATAVSTSLKLGQGIRLFVQSTKEEVTDFNFAAVIGRQANGSSNLASNVVVLIATIGGAGLSTEAAAAAPLERVAPGPAPLPIIGNAAGLKSGPYPHPMYNAAYNFFGNGTFPYGKTVRLMLPFPQEEVQLKKYGIDYVPAYYEGTIMTGDAEVLAEVLKNDELYPKMWTTAQSLKISRFAGHGLFTDSTDSETWKTGHGLLPRAFNAIRIKNYFPIILEKTQTFVHEWAQKGNGVWIEEVNDWFTSMTADAVGKAALDFDMKNVERKSAGEPPHPFIEAFRFGLGYSINAIKPEQVVGKFNAKYNPFCDTKKAMEAKFDEMSQVSADFVDELIEQTRSGHIGGPLSLLSMMLNEVSPSTGEMVKVKELYGHLMTIMIAGHETTAAALGHLFCHLIQNPEVLQKAIAEIESVLGDRVNPTYADLAKLLYVEACFREALRLNPSVVQNVRDVGHDMVLSNKYLLRKGQRFIVNHIALHRDPEHWDQGVYGDPNKFNPERFMPGGPPRHPNAFNAFGFGVRACIGQQLAIMEAKTFLCMMLNFFSFKLPDGFEMVTSCKDGGAAPSPEDLRLYISARPGGPLARAWAGLMKGEMPTAAPAAAPTATAAAGAAPAVPAAKHDTPLLVLFGSNGGTCEDFANQVAAAASAQGFKPTVLSLDAGLKQDLGAVSGATVILSSTYNGTPPDNAAKFASEWLPKQGADSLAGKRFAVFGVGNINWEATYQKFPTHIHNVLSGTAAQELMPLTTVDAADPAFVEDFHDWLDSFIRTLSVSFGLSQVAGATAGAPKKPSLVRAMPAGSGKEYFSDLKEIYDYIAKTYPDSDLDAHIKAESFAALTVTGSKQLQSPDSDRSTCELEVALPPQFSYTAGDHLEVWSTNPAELVGFTMEVCGVTGGDGYEFDLVAGVRNKKLVGKLQKVGMATIPVTAEGLLKFIPDLASVPSRKVIAALAEKCECPPEAAALRKLSETETHKAEVLGKRMTLPELLARFRSVKMSLPELKGQVMAGRCVSLNGKFRLPEDASTPVIMIGPGTGVAPMMGFLEERNVQLKEGASLGPAHLFFGCRSSTTDFIYKELLESYCKSGVLSKDGLHVAFSREPGTPKTYVQDLVLHAGDQLWALLQSGGKVYICGDARRMAPDVRKGFCEVAQRLGSMTAIEAENWMAQMIADGKYLEDVWAG